MKLKELVYLSTLVNKFIYDEKWLFDIPYVNIYI